MTRAQRSHPVVRQWVWLLGALVIATSVLCVCELFWRADLVIYDAVLPTSAAPSDIVIVAADDASVAALGRWPWRRDLHAALLDRLRTMGAKAVAFDVLFTEPDANSPNGDAALAAAMLRGPPTVLPMLVEMPKDGRPLQERFPITPLAQAAAGVGHAHLELDRDGVARSVFLREGFGVTNRSHLALALLESATNKSTTRLPGIRHPDLSGMQPVMQSATPSVWVRDYQLLIPFLGPPGHFKHFSYADVLNGSISADALRDKFVLVGATAQGVGDAYPTPRSGQGIAMSGVEINANVLQALRSDKIIRPLPMVATVVLSLCPILLVAFGFLRLSPRGSLILAAAVWIGVASVSVIALRFVGWWWPPATSLAALLIMYPLWSWRRLEATQVYLEEEFKRLVSEPFPFLGQQARATSTPRFADLVERRIDFVRQAAQRSRDVRRLFSDTINGLPDATLLAGVDGRIVIANPAAAKLFGAVDCATLEGVSVDTQLFERVQAEDFRFAALAAHAPDTSEALLQDRGRHVLIRTVPFFDSASERVGTIIGLTDITELRAAQREREDVLRFLSHDMKSPASSLLGLSQLQRDPKKALSPPELSQRLDVLAQRMLALVDGFVSLARAESADPRVFDEFDLRDALQDAYDEVWATAEARAITMDTHSTDDAVLVRGDRSLMARAIVNLLGNAVKFSPHGAHVSLACHRMNSDGVVRITDAGPGISDEGKAELFQRFSRRKHRGANDPGGAGLGLAFVRVVAEKHGGRAWVENNNAQGSTFCISIPMPETNGTIPISEAGTSV